mgnify:CR=1 FL=1
MVSTAASPWSETVAFRYEMGPVVGRGAQAVVHRARQRSVGRTVAIKTATGSTHPRTRARVHREAVHLARLRHPHVVGVIEAGSDAERPYVVMEWLAGPTLRELLESGPLAPGRAVRLVAGVLDGLGAVHAAGLVHRDIKPSNLMVVDAGTPRERLVIVDFGLSWSAATGSAPGRAGTPRYLAPEACKGHAPAPTTDLYQLALVLAEMLTGSPVVDATTRAACLRHHERGVTLPRGLPARLQPVLRRALCLDPTARYPSAEAMRSDLLAAATPSPHGAVLAVAALTGTTAGAALLAGGGALAAGVLALTLLG